MSHATIKSLIFLQHSCSPQEMLQFDIWHIVVCHLLPQLFIIKYYPIFGPPCTSKSVLNTAWYLYCLFYVWQQF